jgi:hypothetical protein
VPLIFKLLKINKLLYFIFFLSHCIFSQNSVLNDTITTDTIDPVYRRFRVALNYSSANTFLGKKDSVSIPILTPTFKYTTSKDFFYQLNLVHSNTTNKVFDQLDLRAGYNHYFNDQWNATISYTRSFYSKAVDRLNAIVNNDINVYVGYDWNHVYTALSLDYTSGSKDYAYTFNDTIIGPLGKKHIIESKETGSVSAKDYTITLMNSRQFYFYELFNDNDKLIVCPEIDVYYGSQNSVQQSSVVRKLVKGKKQKTTTSNDNTKYPFMAYTFNLDLRYVYKKLTINLSPYYTVPQKLATDTYVQKPFFVMYGGLFYTWKWEKK